MFDMLLGQMLAKGNTLLIPYRFLERQETGGIGFELMC